MSTLSRRFVFVFELAQWAKPFDRVKRGMGVVLGALVLLAGGRSVLATSYTWDGDTTKFWNNAANWDVLPVNAGGHTLIFNAAGTAVPNQTQNDLANPFQLNVMTFGSTMTFAGNDIEFTNLTPAANFAAGITLTFNCGLKISTANTTFRSTVNAANTSVINFNGLLSGGQTLRYANTSPTSTSPSPTFKFAGSQANTINGFTMGDGTSGRGAGKVQIAMDDPFGASGTTLNLVNSGNVTVEGISSTRSIASGVSLRGNLTFIGKSLGFKGSWTTDSGGARTLTCNLDGGETLTFASDSGATFNATRLTINGTGTVVIAGVLSDSATYPWAKTGSGIVRLTSTNTYATQTKVQSGTLEYNSVENKSASPIICALGKPIADGTKEVIALGATAAATLKYIGTASLGHSTDRPLDLAGTTFDGTVDASGVGPISYLGGVTANGVGAKQLILQGTNTGLNTIGGTIVDSSGGATALTKDGLGTWVLTGNSTYTGATKVISGKLIVNGSLASGSAVTVSNGATLGGTGTINGSLLVTNAVVAPGVSGVGTLTNNLTGAATAVFKEGASFTFDLGASGTGDSLAFTALSGGVADVGFSNNAINVSLASGVTNASYTLMTFDAANAYAGTVSIGTGLSGYTINTLTYTPTAIQLTVNAYAAAPTASAASDVTTTSFSANWAAVSGATGYRLDVATDDQFTSMVSGFDNLSVGAVTTYSVGSLTAGSTYYYRVRSENTAGSGANSDVITVSTLPEAPTALAATNVTTSAFHANWGTSTGATGYRLDVATDNGFGSMVVGYNNLNVGNVTTYAVVSLDPETAYYYRVRAENGGGVSANSSVITATTLAVVSSGPRTWDGGSAADGNWSTANGSGNWSGDSAPVSGLGTDLIFATNKNDKVSNNDILDGFELNTLTFSNSVTLSGGALTFSGVSPTVDVANAAATVTIGNNLQLVKPQTVLQGEGVGVLDGVVTNNSASRALVKAGSGSWVLNNVNVYDGGTVVDGGLLRLGATGALPAGRDLTVNGGAVDMAGYGASLGTLTGAGAITNVGVLTVAQAVNATFGGAIAGAGSLTKAGSAILTLSGANTYTGGTTNYAGLLKMGASGALPSGGSLTVNGGAVDMDGYAVGVGTLSGTAGSITNGGGLTVTQAADATFGGAIVGAGSLTKAGAATLTLSGVNTYTGGTINNAGLLKLGAANALPSGKDVTVNGGAVDLANYAISVGNLLGTGGSITNGGGLTVTQAANETFGGVIVGAGGLTKAGAATLTLSGANTYSGVTRIDNGTLALGSGGTINNSSTILLATTTSILDTTVAGMTLGAGQTLAGVGVVSGGVTVASSGTVSPGVSGIGSLTNELSGGKTATFEAGSAFTFDLGAPGSGDGIAFAGLTADQTNVAFNGNTINFVNAGGLAAGTYTLFAFSAANAYTGTVAIGTGLGSLPGSTISYGPSSIQLTVALTSPWIGGDASGAWSQGANWVSGVAPVSSTNNDLVFASNLAGQTSSNNIADPFEVNSMTFSNPLTVAGGQIKLSPDGVVLPTMAFGTNAVTFNNGLALVSNATISTTIANPITFNGQLAGPGKLIYLNEGLSAGTVFKFASPVANTINGFTLGTAATGSKGQATVQVAMDDPFGGTGTTLYFARDNGAIEVVGSARSIASGITIRGNPTFTGNYNLAVHGGVHADSQARTIYANVGGGAVVTFDAAAFYSVSANNYGFNVWAGSGRGVVAGVLANPSQAAIAFTKQGTGIWSLTGQNTFTTYVDVQNGTLEFNSVENYGSASANALGKPSSEANAIILLGNTAQTAAGTLKYIGTAGLGHSTDRLLNLAATTYGGVVDASGVGPISFLSGIGATGLGNKTLTLTGTNTGLNTIGGTISNSIGYATSLYKDGTGTWVLTGTNTYSGLTTVNAGTLALGSGGMISNSSVLVMAGATFDVTARTTPYTVQSGQTLSGRGMVKGALTVAGGGTVVPGTNNIIGTLTNDLTGGKTATFETGSLFTFDLGAAVSSDVLAFTGLTANQTNVAFNGNTVNFTNSGSLAAGIYTLFTFDQANSYSGTLSIGSGVLTAFPRSAFIYNATSIQLNVNLGQAGLWDGGNASGDWTMENAGGNWSGSAKPVSGVDTNLVFSTNKNNQVANNNIADPFEVNTVTVNDTITVVGGALRFAGGTGTLSVAAGELATFNNNLVLSNAVTFFQGAGACVVAGAVQGGANNGMTKAGTGLWILQNTNTYGGLTTVSNGTLVLDANGLISDSSGVLIHAGATLDVTARTAPVFTVGQGKTLSGRGTVKGSVTVADGGRVTPGANNGVGTLTNNLAGGKTATFVAGSGFTFDLAAPGTSDALSFSGLSADTVNVLFNGNTSDFVNVGGIASGIYTIATFDAVNAFSGSLVIGSGLESFPDSQILYSPTNIQLNVVAPVAAPAWDGGNASGLWSLDGAGGNWSGATRPISGIYADMVFLTNKNNQIAYNDVDSPFLANSLSFSNSLTLAGGDLQVTGAIRKIYLAPGSPNIVFNNKLVLDSRGVQVESSANLANTGSITFSNQVSGGRLTYANPGTTPTLTFKFAAATSNTMSGFTLGDGTADHGKANIQIAMDDPFGGVSSTINFARNTSHTITGVGPALRTINSSIANLRANAIFNGSSMTWNGSFTPDGGSQRTVDNNVTAGETLTLAAGVGAYVYGGGVTWGGTGLCVMPGEVRDGAVPNGTRYGFTKAGTGTYRLTGANTYIGPTVIQDGTLEFSSVETNNSTTASALGKPTVNGINEVIALGSTTTTGTMKYIGTAPSGHTTDRPLNLAGTTGGGVVDASGIGPITLTGVVTNSGAGNKVLTLTGTSTGANVLGGAIVNGTNYWTAVLKTGVGTWQLTGENTYTGLTTVVGGSLLVNGSLAAGSSVLVTNGILGGTGTINGSLVVTNNGVVAPGVNAIGTLTNMLSGSARATFAAGASFTFDLGAPGNGDSMAFSGLVAETQDVGFNNTVINFSNAGGLAAGTYTLFTFDADNAYSGNVMIGTGLENFSGSGIVHKSDRIELEVSRFTGSVYNLK